MSLVVDQLERRYAAVRALAGISFAVPQGEIVGLIGPNGSGKSTLLRILATFLAPTRGTARIAGFDCLQQPAEVRRRLGYLPEHLPVEPVARVGEYLDHRARLKGLDRRHRATEVDRCLVDCDLAGVRHRLVAQLSQGFRRRVGLADALLGNPPVLLLDEPTVGLDPLQVRQTRELLAQLSGQTTILVSTHLLAEAELMCARALVLLHGRLISDVRLDTLRSGHGMELEIAASPQQIGTFLRTLPGVTEVQLLRGSESSSRWQIEGQPPLTREAAAAAVHSRGWGLRELRGRAGSLEEHLLEHLASPWKEAA